MLQFQSRGTLAATSPPFGRPGALAVVGVPEAMGLAGAVNGPVTEALSLDDWLFVRLRQVWNSE